MNKAPQHGPSRSSLGLSLKIVAVLGLAMVFARCGEESSIDPTFTSLHSNFFNSCATSGCHLPGTDVYTNKVAMDLSGSKNEIYAVLTATDVDYISNNGCDGTPFIKANDYAGSIVKAMAGTDSERTEFTDANPSCTPTRFGDLCPKTISSQVKSAIQTWVSNGAAND